jgi:hypothetical protein
MYIVSVRKNTQSLSTYNNSRAKQTNTQKTRFPFLCPKEQYSIYSFCISYGTFALAPNFYTTAEKPHYYCVVMLLLKSIKTMKNIGLNKVEQII